MIRKQSLATLALSLVVFSSSAQAQGMARPAGPHKGIGVGMQGDEQGVSVVSLLPGSPAEKAGVKVGDQVVSIAGVSIFDFDQDKMLSITDTAKTITFVVMRGGEKKTFQIEPVVMNLSGPPPHSDAAPEPGRSPR